MTEGQEGTGNHRRHRLHTRHFRKASQLTTHANPHGLRPASDGAVISPSRLWKLCATLSLLVASFECIELCDVTGGLSIKVSHGDLSLER